MTYDAAFWDNLADKYSKKAVDNPEAFERKIAINRELMASDDLILGIGCGTGSLLLRLADAGGQLHGLDLSSEMLRVARAKAEAGGVENVTLHHGPFDSSFQVFEDGSLDGICAYSVLHLLEDRRGALARIARLLKPGGFFVSSTPCIGDSWVPWSPVLKLMRWLGKAPMVKSISRAALVAEMEAAGFVDVESRDVGANKTTAFITARKPAES